MHAALGPARPRLSACSRRVLSGQIGGAFSTPLVNLILTILTLMWCVIITKQQGMCCLAPNINVILWTILICWLAVGTIITIIGCLGLIGLAPYFVVMIIVYAIDLLVLVPLTVWSIQASVATCKGGATTEKPAAPGATVVATPVGP